MVVDVLSRCWGTRLQRHGRRGQSQDGVDTYGTPPHLNGGYVGVQSKNVAALTVAAIRAEIEEAEAFEPALDEYVIATTVDRDAALQRAVREINRGRGLAGGFAVSIWFWDDIISVLAGHPDLVEKHFSGYIRYSGEAVKPAPPRPPVFWASFYALARDDGSRSPTYLKLIAVPVRPAPLTIDGAEAAVFESQVTRNFDVADVELPPDQTTSDAIDVRWRDVPHRVSRHWRRGQDGSVGYTATIDSTISHGTCSLWEVAFDGLMFLRLLRGVLPFHDVELLLDFQPGALQPVVRPITPALVARYPLAVLPGFPEVIAPSDATQIYRPHKSAFGAGEMERPFARFADMLVNRWRVLFRVPSLRREAIAKYLEDFAVTVLGWDLRDGPQ